MLKGSPNSIWLMSLQRFEIWTQGYKQRKDSVKGHREKIDIYKPRNTWGYLKMEERLGTDAFLAPLRLYGPWFWILALRSTRQISVILRHPVCRYFVTAVLMDEDIHDGWHHVCSLTLRTLCYVLWHSTKDKDCMISLLGGLYTSWIQ